MTRANKKRSTSELIADLHAEDIRIRRKALKSLGKRADEDTMKPIAATLHDPDEGVRVAAVKALGYLGPIALDTLVGALHNDYAAVRQQAALSLGALHHPGALKPLTRALNDPDILVRGFAAHALSEIGDQSATPALVAALDDPEFIVRRYVVDALGGLGDPRAVEPLARILFDEDTNTRLNAIDALARIGVPAREPLIGALQHPDAPVRQHAALAVGNLGLQTAIPMLLTAAQADSEALVRGFATHSLGRLRNIADEPDMLRAILTATHDPAAVVRRYAADALALRPDPAALARLIELLQDDVDENVRHHAAKALGKFPQVRAQEALQAAGYGS
ncbi:MAG: HEAT repeat domain-containing protein [Anaerolineales bacterium]